jgi:nucleoid DNA-binding protein
MTGTEIDAWAETALERLKIHRSVRLAGLGEFTVKEYKAYEGRNPRTGKVVQVPGKQLPFFRLSQPARVRANGDGQRVSGDFGDLLERAIAEETVVLGVLGLLVVRHKPGVTSRDPQTGHLVEVPPRSVVTYCTSNTLKRSLNGARPETIPAGALAELMAMPLAIDPRATTARSLVTALAKDFPEARLLVEDRELAQERHSAVCRQYGLASGEVFASVNDGDDPDDADWWALVSRDADPLVARTRDRRRPELRLSRWLAATKVMARLVAVAGDRVLAPADLRRLVAHLEASAPGVAWAWPSHILPF